MRKKVWNITAFIALLMCSAAAAYSQGLGGWVEINSNKSKQLEAGERTSETDIFNRNVYLNFHNSITQMLSYQLNLRTNFSDRDVIDADDDKTTTYQRSMEPAFDILFGSPGYDLSLGGRIQEQWNEAGIVSFPKLRNDGRTTTEFGYFRFNLSPQSLPTLNLELDEQRKFDHESDGAFQSRTTSASIGSAYDLPSRDLKFRYTINYARITDRTPLSINANKTVTDNFNTSYNIGYDDTLWSKKATYSIRYQGNYSRNKTEQFVVPSGTILNQRTSLGGFYAQGILAKQDVDELLSQGNLIDDNTTAIDLSSGQFHNFGILVSIDQPVDRLFVYVNKDISSEANLVGINNWSIFKSDFNQALTWTPVPGKIVNITVDIANNIFRYEIEFSSPQSASFFKAVNLLTSSVPGVFIVKVEAHGTDSPNEEILTTVTNTFNQGLYFTSTIRLLTKLTLSLQYSIDRSDQNPESLERSASGIFENIFSDSVAGEREGFRSNITRNYGGSAAWLTHRLLTTTFRLQRNETFDNIEQTDVSSNTYHLSFNTVPLPTVDATLSLIKNDSYSFDEKSSSNNSVLLSIGTKLHRDVNMITDLGYTRSKSFEIESASSSRRINGSIDAVLTRRISGTINYGFTWTDASETSSLTQEGSSVVTYRPGKAISFTGIFTVADADGNDTKTEGILFDWLPLRPLRLNMNYQHSRSDPGPVTTDTLSSFVIWYVFKFADVRVTSSYTQQKADTKTESYNVNSNLNCRF